MTKKNKFMVNLTAFLGSAISVGTGIVVGRVVEEHSGSTALGVAASCGTACTMMTGTLKAATAVHNHLSSK